MFVSPCTVYVCKSVVCTQYTPSTVCRRVCLCHHAPCMSVSLLFAHSVPRWLVHWSCSLAVCRLHQNTQRNQRRLPTLREPGSMQLVCMLCLRITSLAFPLASPLCFLAGYCKRLLTRFRCRKMWLIDDIGRCVVCSARYLCKSYWKGMSAYERKEFLKIEARLQSFGAKWTHMKLFLWHKLVVVSHDAPWSVNSLEYMNV